MKNWNKVFALVMIISLLILNMKYYDGSIETYGSGVLNGDTDGTKSVATMNREETVAALYGFVDKDQRAYPDLSGYGNELQKISYSSVKTLGDITGSWRGANSSLEDGFYTAYLNMKIQNQILEMVDWQANNPGFEAKITGIDEKYIHIKILEAEDYPADWELKAQDKIQYEYDSKYELHLKYNGTTCIFYRQNDLTDEQIKQLKHLVNINWVSQNNSNLSVSFSYYDIELYDATKKSDDKMVFSGRTYFNTQNSIIDAVPDATVVIDTNSIWEGMGLEKIARLHYQLSHDRKTLTLIYQGKEANFKKINK